MQNFSPNNLRSEYKGLSETPPIAQLPCHLSSLRKGTTSSPCCVCQAWPSCKLNHFKSETQTCFAWEISRSPLGSFPFFFFESLSYTVLFKKLDTHMKWAEAFLCLRISHFLQSRTPCFYTGNTSRKFTKENWLQPPPTP